MRSLKGAFLVWGCLGGTLASADTIPAKELTCAEALSHEETGDLSVTVAEFFIKNKRLPTASELRRRERTFGERGADDIAQLFHHAVREKPELFREWKSKTEKQVYGFFAKRLRMPDHLELAELLGLRDSDEQVQDLLEVLMADHEAPSLMLRAADRLVEAYMRALSQRDTPRHLKTQPVPPTVEELYQALVRAKTNVDLQADAIQEKFTVERLQSVIDQMGGMNELEELARHQNPGRFATVRPALLDDPARAERLRLALENKAGFLVTSVNAGIPLEEDMLATMLKYAEDRDYDVIVYATNNMTGGLDRRLIEHPRVHLVTNTIQNRYFRLWNIGILPKNQNPFASLKKHGQFKPGQTIIVGHPQLAHEIIPTSSNHVRETALWSTGSLSRNLYPFAMPMQARTSYLAKNFHRNAFLVLEKSDAGAGLGGLGVQNHWHVRQVEFKNDAKDPRRGFTDLGREYFVEGGEVKRDHQGPTALFMGDVHEIIADQNFMQAYRNLLLGFAKKSIRVFIEDPVDNTSSNRHEADKSGVLIKRYRAGELDIARELAGLVQFDNALAAIPSVLNRNFKDSNHSYWLKDLLDRRPPAHVVINGPILSELTYARDVLGYAEPLEYLLKYRPGTVANLPPHVRRNIEEKEILAQDPQNVRVMPFGEPLVLGPEWRPTHADKHGHQGTNGARSSPQSHASGSERAITGDSHRSAILGGWINIGTSTPKRIGYNNGGYSSWTNSTALVYPDGTAQLLTFDGAAGTLFARPEQRPLSAEEFFGADKLTIEPNDNDLLPKTEIYDHFSEWLYRRRRWTEGSPP